MELYNYTLDKNEKDSIERFLDYDYVSGINFILDSVKNNIEDLKTNPKLRKVLRDIENIKKNILNIFSAIIKQNQTQYKVKQNHVYIPIERKIFQRYINSEKVEVFLSGTLAEFIAQEKPYPEISDIVILDANLENVNSFKTDVNFSNSTSLIIAPPFKIVSLDYDKITSYENVKSDSNNDREFIKVKIIGENFEYFQDSTNFISANEDDAQDDVQDDVQDEKVNLEILGAEIADRFKKYYLLNEEKIINELVELKGKIKDRIYFEISKMQEEIIKSKEIQSKFSSEQKEIQKQAIELDKTLKLNLDKANNLLENCEKLIKTQQKLARIGAELDVRYNKLIDGFKIRDEATKLNELLTNIYQKFEKFYSNFLEFKRDYEYEKSIGKYIEISKQIGVFLNYLNNPQNSKPKTKIQRFDELIFIEENELKRLITKKADKLIAQANKLILEEELDEIEFKTVTKKVLYFILGKFKFEKYKKYRLEETIELINKKINSDYTLLKQYKMYEVIAKIMVFKSENQDDMLVYDIVEKLTKLENGISNNFVLNKEKIIDKISEIKNDTALMLNEIKSKEEEYDLGLYEFIKKYDYNSSEEVKDTKFVDTTVSELVKITDYVKLSF